jgi:hypothetical protein
MLRWNDVEDKIIFDMTVKMYREPYAASNTTVSIYDNLELDHYAYKHFGSELLAYKILDVNFVQYMEERGDLSRMGKVLIPSVRDTVNTIL